jgi:hypothetical protein
MEFSRSLASAGKIVGNVFLGLGELLLELLQKYAVPPLLMGLTLVGILLVVVIAVLTWPVWPFLIAGAAAWWFMRKRKAVWSRALSQVLLPATVGLLVLTVCLLALNTLGRALAPEDVRAAEMALIQLRLGLKRWITVSWPALAALLAVLVALSYVISSSRLVTRYFRLQRIASSCLVVLTTLTTFTFFARLPVDAAAAAEHQRRVDRSNANISRYELLLRQEHDAVAEVLAMRTLERGVYSLSSGDREQLRALFRTIQLTAAEVSVVLTLDARPSSTGDEKEIRIRHPVADGRSDRWTANRSVLGSAERFPDVRNDVVTVLATRHVEASIQEPGIRELLVRFGADAGAAEQIARRKLAADLIERPPATESEWQNRDNGLAAQAAELAKQESRTGEQQAAAREAVAALTKLFSAAIGVAVPQLEGLTGIFVKKLVSAYAERIFDAAAYRWVGRDGQANSSRRELAALTEPSLPSSTIAKRLLVPRLASAEELRMHPLQAQTQLALQVEALTVDARRIIRENLSRETLEERLSPAVREARERGLTSRELVQEQLRLERARSAGRGFRK